MPRVGEYQNRIVILTRSLAAADSFGEEVETWPDPGDGSTEHWAAIEAPTGGEVPTPPRQGTNASTLRFRHLVPLNAVDRVKVKETGDVYAVVGVWRERAESGGWQTVATISGIY